MRVNNANLILTGIPRSGTTLSCHLLNKLDNTVALHEPMSEEDWQEDWQDDWQGEQSALSEDKHQLSKRVDDFFAQTRQSILQRGQAVSKQRHGDIPDNPKGGYPGVFHFLPAALRGRRWFGMGLRKSRVSRGLVQIEKPLTPDFTLCMKHNGQFTCLLPELAARYRCLAVIRHPLAVLCSWNSIEFAPRDGHMHGAERMDPELRQRLAGIDDRYQRQLSLLSWFYECYARNLAPDQILRYEDLIDSKGRALQHWVSAAQELSEPLQNQNDNALYNRRLRKKLAERLAMSEGGYWQFYPRFDDNDHDNDSDNDLETFR